VVIGAAFLAGSGLYADEPTPVSPPTIFYVGATFPTSGPEQSRGEAMRAGATLAVEEINREGGIRGNLLELKIEDFSSDPRSQVRAFAALAADPQIPVVLAGGEDQVSYIRGVADLNHVLVLSASSRLDATRGSKFIVRIGRPVAQAQEAAIHLFRERRVTNLAVIRGEGQWSEPSAAKLEEAISPLGIKVRHNLPVWDEYTQSPARLLQPLMSEATELVYLLTDVDESERVLTALTAVGFNKPVVHLFACDAPNLPATFKDFSGPQYSIDVDINRTTPAFTQIVEAFAKRYPKIPVSFDVLVAYDAIKLIAKGYEVGATNSEALRDQMIERSKSDGLSGELVIQEQGESTRPMRVNVIEKGECKGLELK